MLEFSFVYLHDPFMIIFCPKVSLVLSILFDHASETLQQFPFARTFFFSIHSNCCFEVYYYFYYYYYFLIFSSIVRQRNIPVQAQV